MNPYISSYPEISWPALPVPHTAGVMAVLFQLEQSQWWTADRLLARQFEQIAAVMDHAYRTIPFYRERIDAFRLDPREIACSSAWRDFPLLSRRDIQLSGDSLLSNAVPESHGRVSQLATGGSTNQPVVTAGTAISDLFWRVLTLRDHFWHRRDLSLSLAAIRHMGNDEALPPEGLQGASWGAATKDVIVTGPTFLLNVRSTVAEQAEWLRRRDPAYVLGYPSVLRGIGQLISASGTRIASLRELRTFGEILEPESRAELEAVFGVPVVDMYSSQEVGYIALQCPEHKHYHVMSENLYVEVLDDQNQPCQPGERGRVVITTLHNFAMPLIRYEIGDYAEVGAPCPCGRGLPVLTRVLGRQRNLLELPDGRRIWPVFDAGERRQELPAFFQFQVIQRSRTQIEVLLVRHQDLTEAERAQVAKYLQQTLGYPFDVEVRRVESIERSRSGKFEDFISEVAIG